MWGTGGIKIYVRYLVECLKCQIREKPCNLNLIADIFSKFFFICSLRRWARTNTWVNLFVRQVAPLQTPSYEEVVFCGGSTRRPATTPGARQLRHQLDRTHEQTPSEGRPDLKALWPSSCDLCSLYVHAPFTENTSRSIMYGFIRGPSSKWIKLFLFNKIVVLNVLKVTFKLFN